MTTLSSWRTTATGSTGLNVRRATGLTVAESKENFTPTESVARGSREGRVAYEAETEALLYVFFKIYIYIYIFDRCKVFQSDRKLFHEGTGILFSSQFFRFHLHCFCGAPVPCCAFSFVQQYIQQEYQKRKG